MIIRRKGTEYNLLKTDYSDIVDFFNGFLDEPLRNHVVNILYESDMGVTVEMSDDEKRRYRYNPKLVSQELYGTPDFGLIILMINNISHIGDFDCEDSFRVLSEDEIYMLKSVYKTFKV